MTDELLLAMALLLWVSISTGAAFITGWYACLMCEEWGLTDDDS